MAELANVLAFNAYDAQSSVYTHSLASSTTQQNDKHQDPNPRDRDSGVFLSDTEDDAPPPSLPTLIPRRKSSLSQAFAPSTKPTATLTRTDSLKSNSTTTSDSPAPRRLRRPAELNLKPSQPKPKSELELRYDLIRNSTTQSRAALKSPTQLLKDRLNLSPKKPLHEKTRIFTPPRPMLNGCILPAPQAQLMPFSGREVRARTEGVEGGRGRPAWWCKVDRVVVFDGVAEEAEGEKKLKFRTRSSKGLSIARRRGEPETVVIPLECCHCREMLNRTEWKYDVLVCKRSVCWDCNERCRWEMEREEEEKRRVVDGEEEEGGIDSGRDRADSVLQDGDAVRDEELMAKVGIETGARSPIEAVGGIEERLERRIG